MHKYGRVLSICYKPLYFKLNFSWIPFYVQPNINIKTRNVNQTEQAAIQSQQTEIQIQEESQHAGHD